MTENKAHITIIHRDDSDYIKWSLLQARRSNPNAAIDLIGRKSNDHYDFVTHHDLGSYMKSADEFARNYKHHSAASYDLTLFTIQRYFILKDFMQKNGVEHCYCYDSDAMIFFDYAAEHEMIKDRDLAIVTDKPSVASMLLFCNNQTAIVRFCQFIMDAYTGKDPQTFDRLRSVHEERKKRGKGGGAGDMLILFLYQERYPERIIELTWVKDETTHDVNINAEGNGDRIFEMRFGVKKIDWIEGSPYGTDKDTGKKIRFKTLHFQGAAKQYMERAYCNKAIVPFLKGMGTSCKRVLKGKINAVKTLLTR